MEPRTSAGEQLPQAPQPEQWAPPGAIERPAVAPEHNELQRVAPIEQSAAAAQVEMASAPPAVATNLPAPQSDDATAAYSASDDVPLVAADEDVIEKEWVDKAKNILAQTKDDPHLREQQIKKLQVEYLRKRYGREIGEAVD